MFRFTLPSVHVAKIKRADECADPFLSHLVKGAACAAPVDPTLAALTCSRSLRLLGLLLRLLSHCVSLQRPIIGGSDFWIRPM